MNSHSCALSEDCFHTGWYLGCDLEVQRTWNELVSQTFTTKNLVIDIVSFKHASRE